MLSLAAIRARLKTPLTFGLVAVFGLSATGCSLTSSGSANTAVATPILVRVWRYNQDFDPIRDIITDFQSKNPTIKVTYTKNSLDGYETSALRSMTALNGPDIWSIPNDWLGDYQSQVVPLPDNFFFDDGKTTGTSPVDKVKALFPAGIANQIILPGNKVAGLPTNVDTLHLFYNPDIFDQALQEYRLSLGDNFNQDQYNKVRKLLSNPPTTWEDVLTILPYLTKKSGSTISRSGIALGTADNIPSSNDILQLLILQNGGGIINSDRTRATFHLPITTPSGATVRPGEKAVDFYTSFADPTRSNYTWNASLASALDAFAQGKVAMVIGYTSFEKDLAIKYPNFHASHSFIPQIVQNNVQPPVNFIKYSLEVVTKTANNKAAAFAFIKQYTTPGISQNLASEQKLFSPFLATLNSQISNGEGSANQIITGQSTYKVHREQFDGAIHKMIVDVSQNGVNASDATDTAANTINALLTQSN